MNGNVKFHKATSPAFNPGEVWVDSSGRYKVTIVSVSKHPGATSDHSSSYGVTYELNSLSGKVQQYEKDCWNFQVRYTHAADLIAERKS